MNNKQSLRHHKLDNCEFRLPERYIPTETLGFGSFGYVVEAKDTKANQLVAIKKITNITDITDLKRVIREIIILKNLKHDNLVELLDVILIQRYYFKVY